jgi:phosphomannomutase
VREIHQERNPYFGGINPEPIRPNVDEALAFVAAGGYDLALLLDGDADRAGAADERGTFIHQLQVTGLLMYYLAEHRGWRDPVVVSVNNTSMAARLGERYGIATHETPVGFKFIGPKMIETGAMMGAEESGGFGFGMHLPERDGI